MVELPRFESVLIYSILQPLARPTVLSVVYSIRPVLIHPSLQFHYSGSVASAAVVACTVQQASDT